MGRLCKGALNAPQRGLMSYRPQFALPPAPEGCTYEEFIYAFDDSNTPALIDISNLPSGEQIIHIPLHLDGDADFLWLGTKIDGTTLGVKFETPWTEPLSDDYVPATLYAGNIVPTVVEAAVECPAGSVISLSVKNLS